RNTEFRRKALKWKRTSNWKGQMMFAGSESSMDPTAACDHLRHDHRQMEECLDRLFAAVSHSGPELVSQVRSAMSSLQRLEAAHFEKEESLFYPKLRPTMRGLLIMSH